MEFPSHSYSWPISNCITCMTSWIIMKSRKPIPYVSRSNKKSRNILIDADHLSICFIEVISSTTSENDPWSIDVTSLDWFMGPFQPENTHMKSWFSKKKDMGFRSSDFMETVWNCPNASSSLYHFLRIVKLWNSQKWIMNSTKYTGW